MTRRVLLSGSVGFDIMEEESGGGGGCGSSGLSSHRYEVLKNEYQASKRKLESKNEALLILTQELDECRKERDQFKLMADQLRNRCQTLKKQLSMPDKANGVYASYSDTSVAVSAQLEMDNLRQKLSDAEGDVKVLREKIAKQRLGTSEQANQRRNFAAHERESLVNELEEAQEKYAQLEQDMKQVFDEREELVTERDTYRSKYSRLNEELNFLLRGDEKHIVDIDALSMDNRYLQERVKQMEEENSLAKAAVSKYKQMLDRKKPKGILKVCTNEIGGVLISHRQVKQMLSQPVSSIQPTLQVVEELRSLAGTLLETIQDKNLALSHQRKSNKLLGGRITDLENKLKNVDHSAASSPTVKLFGLKDLAGDFSNIRSLIPSLSYDGEEEESLCESSVCSDHLPSGPESPQDLSPAHERSDKPTTPKHHATNASHTTQNVTESKSETDNVGLHDSTGDEQKTKSLSKSCNGQTQRDTLLDLSPDEILLSEYSLPMEFHELAANQCNNINGGDPLPGKTEQQIPNTSMTRESKHVQRMSSPIANANC